MPRKASHTWRGKHSAMPKHHKRHRWGLRRRLTIVFAFVALAAVTLTTWLTLGAVFNAQRELFNLQFDLQGEAIPFSSDFGSDRRFGPFGRSGDSNGLNGLAGSGGRFDSNNSAYLGMYEGASAAFRQITRTAFLAALLSFLLASGVAAAVTRFLTRPLLALTDGAKRLEAGERNIQLAIPPAKDELRELTVAFNNMSTGLERQETWRQNMVADVAHDLRTPLSVLRSEIEAMQDGVINTDAQGLERLHQEVMLMAGLVDDLKTLSMAESGVLNLDKSVVNIYDLLERIADSFHRRATEVDSTVVLNNTSKQLSATLDAEQMNRVISNLIDNALLYASPSTIELSARLEEDGIVLSVRDGGKGIPEDRLIQIFERFYRGDSARSANAHKSNKRGSGLGLNIAKAISEAHAGQIRAFNHPDGGAVFEVWLPSA